MSQEQAIQFLQQGIAAAKAKRNDEARQFLQNAIRLNPGSETAWLWLSSVAKDQQERIFCLRQILQINPENEMALKGLKALGVAVTTEEGQPAAGPSSSVPRPSEEKIAAARRALGPLIADLTQQEDPLSGINWVRKRRNRAGERAATLFSIAIRVIPILIIAAILGGGALFISQNPDAIVLAPTWTPSFTPTVTATPTPGFTPTPSPTPEETYTPTPPIPAGLPQGDLFTEMTNTPVYPRFVEGRIVQEAVILMDDNRDAIALPTLAAVRDTLLDTSDNPNPFYYQAVALTNLDDTEQAEAILEEGLARMEQTGGNPGLIHAGLAYVYAADGRYADSDEQAELALQNDPELPQPYYTLARNAIRQERFDDASARITEALGLHPADVNLWILEGRLNIARDEPADAQQNARIALYIDPTAEEAYLLQAEADIAIGDYGLAVLHLQDYLFTYPGSITGWTLLGDTRVQEGNLDLAIDAYSRAVNTDTLEAAQVPALMARADLYVRRYQYAQAVEDYTRILRFDDTDMVALEGRAQANLAAGRYRNAIADLDDLLEADPNRNDLRLLKAQAVLDGANPRNTTAYEAAQDEAFDILAGGFPTVIADDSQRALAYEYRARIRLNRNEYQAALDDITAALELEESGSRHYLRGQVHEARRENELALREYEWIVLWSRIYDYPFLPDALARLEALSS